MGESQSCDSSPDKYEVYEKEFSGGDRPRSPKGKKRGRKSEIALRQAEASAGKLARRLEAENVIRGRLNFLKKENDQDGRGIERYASWVGRSLKEGGPHFVDEDLSIDSTLPKVKAGGQHHQKNQTAALVKHLPTGIVVRNEEERSFQQNKELGKAVLYQRLDEYLRLWKTVLPSETDPSDIRKKIEELLTE